MLAKVIAGPIKPVFTSDLLSEVVKKQVSKPDRVRIEIDVEMLECLMKNGPLYAADIRCLDCESKKCIQKMVLKNFRTT